jgi:hypothetical protein
MKRNHLILFSLVLLLGCQAEIELVGTYKARPTTAPERNVRYVFQGFSRFSVGRELALYRDATFRLTSCGNIATGRWYQRHDSLFLAYETNVWRNDSLEKHGLNGQWPPLPPEPVVLRIKGGNLIGHECTNEGEKDQKVYVVLKKE